MANLILNIAPMGSKAAKARDLVRSRIRLTQTRFGGMNKTFRQLNRYYLSLSPPIENRQNDRPISTGPRRDEDLFVPVSFSVIESAMPHWMFSQFGSRPFTRVRGKKPDWHERAEGVEKMVDHDMILANVFGESLPIGKSLFKYGTGLGKVTYKFEGYMSRRKMRRKEPQGFSIMGELLSGWMDFYEKVPVVEYDGPALEWVSIYNFGIDPLYWRLKDMRYVWERRWTDRETLKHKNEMYRMLTGGKDLYKNIDKIPEIPRGGIEEIYQMDGGDDTSEAMGWSPMSNRTLPFSQIRDAEKQRDRAIEIIEYWEDDRVVEVANGETTIRDASGDDFPYMYKEKPYFGVTCIPIEGSFYGMGLLHPIRGPQEELNSWRNLNMRQGKLNALNVWAVDEDVDIPPTANELNPGDVVQVPFYANGKPGVIPLFQGRPLPPESYNFENILQSDIQRAIAFNDFVMGGVSAGGSETATEARMLSQGSAVRIRLINQIAELYHLTEVARLFLRRRQQFFKEEEIFRISGRDAPGAIDFLKLTPSDIMGEYDFEVVGPQMQPNQDVLRQQMLQAIALVKGDPVLMQLTNLYELWKELWKMFDVRFTDRFVVPPTVKTISPEQENIILLNGEWIGTQPTEPHEEHAQKHYQVIAQARDERSRDNLLKHIDEHERFLKAKQAQAPPQEQPGLRGYAGNVPNLENAAESQGGIEARVGGGQGS